ncbi:Allergen V5/Tpx-1-related protein [Corchorus olitorius]|uniref:Allergen V5/Tpx-1-related protein n=1 Tax=Corchorus olitorius TaxID=93759 RepID=A0A1R3J6Z3_9ROSI|nr:Allergen V5/Tpx-1-related protein [Corchorus olitorius]
MEIRTKFSCSLLGTFLLLSSFLSVSLSYSYHDFSSQLISRRLLKQSSSGNLIQQFLKPHNVLRAQRGLPPLKWSKKLANYASWWANKRKGDCALIHSNSNYGENLFWGSGKDWKPEDAVAAWAAEKSNYNYKTNSCKQDKDCLHYTQIIWRKSSKVGCAKVVCRTGDTIIVCNYDPHGNVIGEKPF